MVAKLIFNYSKFVILKLYSIGENTHRHDQTKQGTEAMLSTILLSQYLSTMACSIKYPIEYNLRRI